MCKPTVALRLVVVQLVMQCRHMPVPPRCVCGTCGSCSDGYMMAIVTATITTTVMALVTVVFRLQ